MRLSYVIISRNHKDTLLKTLALLPRVTPLPPSLWEICVVDNASADGSADAVAEQFPRVQLIRNATNQGSTARNAGFAMCGGQYIISLDDDSYPMDHRSVSTALSRMDRENSLGAIVGRVTLPGGGAIAPALPGVVMSRATCFRKSVLDEVGGFRAEARGQVEEYDLSFRIWGAGYRVERCEQVVFHHEKIADEEVDSRLAFQERLRNHLLIARRFLPAKLANIYWADWKLRYTAIAKYNSAGRDAWKGLWNARRTCLREMFDKQTPLGGEAIESIFGFRSQATAVGNWARQNSIWRVVIADFSKNIYATYNACRSCGLQIRCIADNNPAFEDLEYRTLPIVALNQAFEGGGIEGVVLANINAAQVDARMQSIRHHFHGPILRLWKPNDAGQVMRASAA